MKREDDIFRKLKNEKPLVKTVGQVPRKQVDPERSVSARRRIGVQPDAPQQSAAEPIRRESPQERPTVRRRISPVPQEPQNSATAPSRKERMNIPHLDHVQALTSKVGGDPRSFSRPTEIMRDTAERAPLTYRHEEKFYISYSDYIILRQQLRAVLHPDPHADENGEYYIRSLYLDDIYDTAVTEKNAGIQFRHKYRIRIYDFSKNKIRFEKKIKSGAYIAKIGFDMSYDEYQAFLRGDIEFLLHKESPLAKEVYLQVRQNRLKPVVVVDYEREPFIMDYETIRITFDKNLRSGTPSWDIFDENLPRTPMLEKGIVVLEVKYNRALPDYLARLVNGISAIQTSAVSKYIICRQYD